MQAPLSVAMVGRPVDDWAGLAHTSFVPNRNVQRWEGCLILLAHPRGHHLTINALSRCLGAQLPFGYGSLTT